MEKIHVSYAALILFDQNTVKTVIVYKPDYKKVGTLYKLWIKKEFNNLQIS